MKCVRRAALVCMTAAGMVAVAAAVMAADPGAVAAASSATVDAIVLRDDLGREVTLAHHPQRIVSLLPSLTETVCALGACGRLVATDRYSDWPAEVRSLPKAGGLEDAQVEEIVRLRPDVVLISRTQRITDRLRELGIESIALESQTYASIAHTVTAIGFILGLPERATALNREIEKAVADVSAAAQERRHGTPPTVYFEVDRAPYAAGPESFIGELLARLETRNIVAAGLGPFPRLNPEYIVRHNPDVIIISTDAPTLDDANFADRPGWSRIRAVKEQRICSFPAAVRDTLVRPGPRVADGMRAIERCLERVAP
jgi:cobalamin transport system substrate-binding protein